MIVTDIIQFLRDIPPFQFLDEEDLTRTASRVAIRFFPKNAFILRHDDLPNDRLIVIKKGGIKLFHRSDKNVEALSEYCGEGGLIDFSLLLDSGGTLVDAIAVEDTVCYLIAKESMQNSLARHDMVSDFLQKSFIGGYCSRKTREIKGRNLIAGEGENILFKITVGELVTKPVISAPQQISIHEAAKLMAKHRTAVIILVEDFNVPVGIVTDREMSEKVVAVNRDLSEPVSTVMNMVPIRIDAREYCIEALLKMTRYDTRHLLVVDNGKFKGVITNHDLLMVQGATPFSLTREIDCLHTIDGLAGAAGKITDTVALLIKGGAKACNIMYVISEIRDRIMRKVMELAEKKNGHPPLSYCVIALGNAGRGEQTLRTEHDYAIVYADPLSPAEEGNACRFFSEFIPLVSESIERCGLDKWRLRDFGDRSLLCLPLGGWKRLFMTLVASPAPERENHPLSLFDFRPVHGDFSLAFDLRDQISLMIQDHRNFIGRLANTLIHGTPQVGTKRLDMEEKGKGHMPGGQGDLMSETADFLVDIARLFAVDFGIRETSTLERLGRLKTMDASLAKYADELENQFEFIMLFRICRQFELIGSGARLGDADESRRLDTVQRKIWRDSFFLVSKAREVLVRRYGRLPA